MSNLNIRSSSINMGSTIDYHDSNFACYGDNYSRKTYFGNCAYHSKDHDMPYDSDYQNNACYANDENRNNPKSIGLYHSDRHQL